MAATAKVYSASTSCEWMSLTTLQNAASRVFSIPELLEMILVGIDIKHLFIIQQISKDFEATIRSSILLRREMLLEQTPSCENEDDCCRYKLFNPLLCVEGCCERSSAVSRAGMPSPLDRFSIKYVKCRDENPILDCCSEESEDSADLVIAYDLDEPYARVESTGNESW